MNTQLEVSDKSSGPVQRLGDDLTAENLSA
jgi:hypothetical protein